MMDELKGQIHSFQSLGTLDGPGVRFVVFMQGCHLRCGCCHNPDTWEMSDGKSYTVEEIVSRVVRYREYYKDNGGITVSGGEPLLQSRFVFELFSACLRQGINTCLDTSGSVWNEDVKHVLSVTNRVLLDIKYTTNELYETYVGCTMEKPLQFLRYLEEQKIPVTLRQVIIPTLNDNEENMRALRAIKEQHTCIDRVELLPFRKICQVKYDKMNMDFAFKDIPEANAEEVRKLELLHL